MDICSKRRHQHSVALPYTRGGEDSRSTGDALPVMESCMALEVKPKGFLAMHSYLPWSATPRSWMERVPSWLMWNLPLSVIWMPSCCTVKRQKTCQGVESFPPSQPSAHSANPQMDAMK